MEESSRLAYVDYFRCGRCAHVWTAAKDSGALIAHITEPYKDQPLRVASQGAQASVSAALPLVEERRRLVCEAQSLSEGFVLLEARADRSAWRPFYAALRSHMAAVHAYRKRFQLKPRTAQ